jgi:glycosyltransferase involved in cell wall biosynthesis
MKKPKVLILGKLPPPYIGPAVATKILLDSKLKEGYELLHVNTKINSDISTMGRWGFRKIWASIAIYFKLWWTCVRHRPKLVLIPISQTTMGFLKDAMFILIAAFTLRKTVVQLRGSNFKNWLDGASRGTRTFVRFMLNCTSGVIVLGQNLRYLFEPYFPSDRIFVVPNGRQFQQTLLTTDPPNPERIPNVLYLANFLPSKGFEDVLQALVILKKRGITQFHFSGAGSWDNPEYEANCYAIIADNALQADILPPLSGSAKSAIFTGADIFVFTPRMPEGHPWVIVEAMASSLPVVATDQGAIVESVLEGKNGFIVPVGSPDVIADRLEQLITDKALRERMSDRSYAHYKANFTEEKMVANLTLVFEAMINGRSAN